MIMAIKITYRRTSRLSMRIGKNGDINISAPLYASKNDIENFIRDNHSWIETAQEHRQKKEEARQAFFGRLQLNTRKSRTEAVKKLNDIVTPMVEKYSKAIGVAPTSITYKATISKWGSCNIATRQISFSIYLLLLPIWCIEHVVVHEIAHLIVPNHSKEFYEVMDKHFPRWREARQATKNIASGNS